MSFTINTNSASPQAPAPRTNSDSRTKTTNRVTSDTRIVSNGDVATSATVNNVPSDHALITHANRGFADGAIDNAGEVRILDADQATETANLTKASTLLQTSPVAVAQANSAPQAVLSLLQR